MSDAVMQETTGLEPVTGIKPTIKTEDGPKRKLRNNPTNRMVLLLYDSYLRRFRFCIFQPSLLSRAFYPVVLEVRERKVMSILVGFSFTFIVYI